MESIVQGTVIHGDHEGKQLGFPTANLSTPASNIEPAYGIYAGTVTIEQDTTAHPCAIVIRERNNEKALEVHILNFDNDLYDKQLTVTVKNFIRNWQEFSDVEALKKQIAEDLSRVQEILETN